MRKMEKLHVRKTWIPNCVIHVMGRLHAKRGLIAVERETVRSPYLLERRNAYAEYREKLLKEEGKVLQPMKQELFKTDVERKLKQEQLMQVEMKLSKLQEPQSGGECRLKIRLEQERESIALAIAEAEAAMQEVEENLQLVRELASHLLQEKLSLLQSKAYAYILGADSCLKEMNHYLNRQDMVEESFANLLPEIV